MKVVEARKQAGLTQDEVAGHLGVSRVTYGKMERNPETITLEDAKKMAALFKVSIGDIFFDEEL